MSQIKSTILNLQKSIILKRNKEFGSTIICNISDDQTTLTCKNLDVSDLMNLELIVNNIKNKNSYFYFVNLLVYYQNSCHPINIPGLKDIINSMIKNSDSKAFENNKTIHRPFVENIWTGTENTNFKDETKNIIDLLTSLSFWSKDIPNINVTLENGNVSLSELYFDIIFDPREDYMYTGGASGKTIIGNIITLSSGGEVKADEEEEEEEEEEEFVDLKNVFQTVSRCISSEDCNPQSYQNNTLIFKGVDISNMDIDEIITLAETKAKLDANGGSYIEFQLKQPGGKERMEEIAKRLKNNVPTYCYEPIQGSNSIPWYDENIEFNSDYSQYRLKGTPHYKKITKASNSVNQCKLKIKPEWNRTIIDWYNNGMKEYYENELQYQQITL